MSSGAAAFGPCLGASAAWTNPLHGRLGRQPPTFSGGDDCNAGICGVGPSGPVYYPTQPDVHYSAAYNVPSLPNVPPEEIKSTACKRYIIHEILRLRAF